MWRNLLKAMAEHRPSGYRPITKEMADSCFSRLILEEEEKRHPLVLDVTICEEIGKKSSMEDVTFFSQGKAGVLMGIFDGHRGSCCAEYASARFQELFETLYESCGKNALYTFELLIYLIEIELIAKIDENPTTWVQAGSTCLVCFFEGSTRLLYTATVGDSEAFYIEKKELKRMIIPLSCVRKWTDVKEANRASLYLKDPSIKESWPKRAKDSTAKEDLRVDGINMSRSLGDFISKGTTECPGLISKPKVTAFRVKPGSVVVLASDGVWDFVTAPEVADFIDDHHLARSETPLARWITDRALTAYCSDDNLSAIVVKFF